MKNQKNLWCLIVAGSLFIADGANATTKISRIEFFGKNSPNQMVIVGDGPIEFEKIDNPADKQVIFEIKNAKLANANAGRRLDTASFNSKVSLISPYNVEGKNAVRIILQMREPGDVTTLAQGSRLFVGIDGSADANILPGGSDRIQTASSADQPHPSTPEARIDQFVEATQTKKYVGRHITLQVKDADLTDVFKLIGETSGFNMVIGSDVVGKISLSLVDVPWDLALDTILTSNKLGAERTGNILRIAQLTTLTQEKSAQQIAKFAADNSAPRITRIFPLSYATGASILPVLTRFGGGNAGANVVTTNRTETIVVDERTNSLVIQDTAENLERIAKIIKLLDRQTPQVQIEAKIIQASETFAKLMGGNFGFVAAPAFGGVGGSFLQGKLTSVPELPGSTTSSKGGNSLGMTMKIGALANLRLSALLNLEESEGRNKVISSPRTVVLNKQTASIIQSQPVLVPVTTQNPTTGASIASSEVKQANLSLKVTPTVTNDGNIVMKLDVANDTSETIKEDTTGIANRNIQTEVVAESGSTIAIGGIYTMTESEGSTGIPGLRKLPIIGTLFGSESKNLARSELFIFITPRILNEETMNPSSDNVETKQSSAVRR